MPVTISGQFVEMLLKEADGKKTLKRDDEGTKDEFLERLENLRKAHYVNERFAHTVHFQSDAEVELPHPELRGSRGTQSPNEASFLYLDVGAWVGSKHQPWGGDRKDPKIKRDFGIVCGPLVLLCSFEYALSSPQKDGLGSSVRISKSCKAWTDAKKHEEPFRSVNVVLDCLSKPAPGEVDDPHQGKLGAVVVREMRRAPGANPQYPKEPRDWVVHVILGDMHIPVLDKEVQTYGGAGVKVHNEQTGAHQYTRTITAPDRVPRLGRVDLQALKAVVLKLISSDADSGTKLLLTMANVANRNITSEAYSFGDKKEDYLASVVAAERLLAGLGDAKWFYSDTAGVQSDTMSFEDATEWYKYYREGKDGKPADIFEDAGTHFLQFVQRLATYSEKKNEDPELFDVRFLQLGDFLDFWVGFTCHFNPSNHPDQPVQPTNPIGERLVHHWATNLLSNTDQGKLVAAALELAEEKDLDPSYLYGNHDNYLGSISGIQYRPKTFLAPRLASYSRAGIYMEHGHQWEGSNADNAKPTPTTATVIGTKSPLGLFVTQAAFVRPSAVRAFEGTAAGVVAAATGTFGQRLDQIAGAASRFISEGGGFYCYVMGHTHEACLTKVVLKSPWKSPVVRFMDEHNRLGKGKVFITRGGQKHENILYVSGGDQGQGVSVDVEWREMMGDKTNEWVALEDPLLISPQMYTKAVKGLAAANEKGVRRGKHTFTNVPPGLYEARFYLTRVASECFRNSKEMHRNRIAVQGISLQGDAENTVGKRYAWEKGTGITGRILLRWAFPDEYFAQLSPWFALYRPDDDNKIVQFGMDQEGDNSMLKKLGVKLGKRSPYPYRRFSDCMRTSIDNPTKEQIAKGQAPGAWYPNVGCWELDEDFKRTISAEPLGKWQIRAFQDYNQHVFLGAVEFEIVKAPPHAKPKKRA